MSNPGGEYFRPDGLSVGATRPAVIKGLNVPFWFILPIAIIPLALVMFTGNPFWLLIALVLTFLARLFVTNDHNRPRVVFLALISGGLLAIPSIWGRDSVDPLGKARHER